MNNAMCHYVLFLLLFMYYLNLFVRYVYFVYKIGFFSLLYRFKSTLTVHVEKRDNRIYFIICLNNIK